MYESYENPRISLSDMLKRFSIMEICGLHSNPGSVSGFLNSKRLWMLKTEKMSGICFLTSLELKNESSTTWMSKKLFLESSTLDFEKKVILKNIFFLSVQIKSARENVIWQFIVMKFIKRIWFSTWHQFKISFYLP